MTHVCPFCDWPEFTEFRKVEQASRGRFGLRFRCTGKIVVCARCAEQYVIGDTGAYKIAQPREPKDVPSQPRGPVPQSSMVDEDQAKLW